MSITTYIPQRPPMVMIDRILHSDERGTLTQFEVKSDNIFIEKGKLAPPGLVENMAQTAAARAGHIFITQNQAVKLGFLGGIKRLKIHQRPPIGAILQTNIKELGTVLNISSVAASIQLEGEEIATCEMKIFVMD